MNKLPGFDTVELKRLLFIPDPSSETIFGVVGRMEVLLGLFEKEEEYHSLMPFLKTYYFVTKAAAEKYFQKKHYFTNLRAYETLDVYFASLYFKPLFIFLTRGEHVTPWKTYFDYCSKLNGVPFLQMILGINAQINADLYKALVYLKYKDEKDFFLVNDILQEVIPDVIKFMVFSEHDIYSIRGLVMKDFFLTEFHTIIERWRSEAYMRVRFPKHAGGHTYKEIAAQTEKIAAELVSDFASVSVMPVITRAVERLENLSLLTAARDI